MSNQYVPKSFEESEKESTEKQRTLQKRMEDLRLNTYNRMKNDLTIQEYLQQFREASQEDFMRSYAHCKSLFMEYGDSHAAIGERRDEGNVEDAQNRLMDIQIKKLFDVMLQWDARLVEPEGIECSWDFYKWKSNLACCPLITPISQQDFDLYMQYANSPDFEYQEDVDLLSIAYDDDDEDMEMPGWFLYENLHTGNNKCLLLPRLRTQKEDFYRGLARKEEHEKIEKKYETGELQKIIRDTRPAAPSLYYKGIEDFVKRFENRDVLTRFYKYYEFNTDRLIRDNEEDEEHGYLNERVETAIFNLQDIKEKISVEANSDWRQAVIDAYENYSKQQVIAGLQYAYSDYCNRLANGMSYLFDEDDFKGMQELADNVRNQILRGRELNGEERNFDF